MSRRLLRALAPVGASVGACSDVEGPRFLHFELVSIRFLFQCAFLLYLLNNFVFAFVGLLETNLLFDLALAFVRLFDGIHCYFRLIRRFKIMECREEMRVSHKI